MQPSNRPCCGTRMRPRLFGSTTSLLSFHTAVGAVEAEIHGAGDAAAGHRGGHALQVLGGVADEVLDRLAVDERGRNGILQRR